MPAGCGEEQRRATAARVDTEAQEHAPAARGPLRESHCRASENHLGSVVAAVQINAVHEGSHHGEPTAAVSRIVGYWPPASPVPHHDLDLPLAAQPAGQTPRHDLDGTRALTSTHADLPLLLKGAWKCSLCAAVV